MSLTRSLTRPLTRPLNASDISNFKYGGSFDPLALDPYLLFDAETSMRGTLEAFTLDLDPANPSTLDVITANRSGVATFTDANGVIQSASANTVRVDHTQGAELTPTKFQRFVNTAFDQAYWSFSSQMGSPVYNYDTAPNGEQEATRIVSNGGSYPQIVETITGLTVGQEYTASFYVKSDGTSQIQQSTHVTGVGSTVNFTPTNEWQRISVIITATATTHNFVIFTSNSSAPASSYLIWGPQFEEGTTASSFVANTTGSPNFITGPTFGPRVPMILVEPSAINLVDYSEDFTHSSWLKQNVTVSAAPVSAPDGTMTATHVVKVTSEGHLVKPSIVTNGSDRISIWAKTVSGSGTVFFNYHTGTPSTVTDQWQRFEVTANAAHVYAVNFRGSSTLDELYIWGAQGEAGSVSTSYIPTSGGNAAARTRAADDLVITGSAFTEFYNQSEGTFYVEVDGRVDSTGNYLFNIKDSTVNTNAIRSRFNSGNYFQIRVNHSNLASISQGSLTLGTVNRVSGSYKSTNAKGSVNGSGEQSVTISSVPSGLSSMHIGSYIPDNFYLNGHIKRLIYWPTHSDSL